MTTTSHIGATLLEASQAQKEVTVNEALTRIDALLNTGAIDRDLTSPPSNPTTGDLYIVAASPATGDWSGQENAIAYFDQIWRFITPREGVALWVNDEDKLYRFNGTAWAEQVSSGGGGSSGGIADGEVTTSKLANGAVTNAKLANNAVTAANITDGEVTSAKLAAGTFAAIKEAATSSATGVVQLADAAAVSAGTTGRVVDAAQLKTEVASVGYANPATQTQYATLQTLTDAASISWNTSTAQVAQVTLAGNRALANPASLLAGATYVLLVKQDATGSRTLSFGSQYKFPDGTAPTLSTATNAVDLLSFFCDGSAMYGVAQTSFA